MNGENAADGRGITAKIAERLLASGADVVTLGNWAWGQKGFAPYLSGTDRVLRPANMSPVSPGRGLAVHDGVAVISLLGELTLKPYESPFLAADRLVAEARRETPVVLVDFHAEATSEGSARRCEIETTIDGAPEGWMSMRDPYARPFSTTSSRPTTVPSTGE